MVTLHGTLHSERIPFSDGFRVNEYVEVRGAMLPNGVMVSGNAISIDGHSDTLLFTGPVEFTSGITLSCRGLNGTEAAESAISLGGDSFMAFGPEECYFLVKDDSLRAFAGSQVVAQISFAQGNRYTDRGDMSFWGRSISFYLNKKLPQIYYIEDDDHVRVYATSPSFATEAIDEGSLTLLMGEFFERHGMDEPPLVVGLDSLEVVGEFLTACRDVIEFNPHLFDYVDKFYFNEAPLYVLGGLALIPQETRSSLRIISHNPFFHSVYTSGVMSGEELIHEMTHAKDWVTIEPAIDLHWSNISPKFSHWVNFPIYLISTRMSDGDEEPPPGYVSLYAMVNDREDKAETVRYFAKDLERFARRYLDPFSPWYDPVVAEKVRILISGGYIPADKIPPFAMDYVRLSPME